jgi:predicted LPLAT superfamily acyltransferase
MLTFSQSLLDKMSAWMGDIHKMVIDFQKPKEYEKLALSGKGALLIGSHLGNLELARALAIYNKHIHVNAVVYSENAQRFTSVLRELHVDFGVNLIQVSNFGPETAIQLKEKVDSGELVVIVGDRTPPLNEASGRICRVDFLGKKAPFAQGPFVLASLLDCPVYLFFCLYEEGRHRIYMEHFAEQIHLTREKRMENLHTYIQQYASRLEYYCLKTPMQWFNFYDFWREQGRAQEVAVEEIDSFSRH